MNENILLCGNPNVGKSSLFNILTHSYDTSILLASLSLNAIKVFFIL